MLFSLEANSAKLFFCGKVQEEKGAEKGKFKRKFCLNHHIFDIELSIET